MPRLFTAPLMPYTRYAAADIITLMLYAMMLLR